MSTDSTWARMGGGQTFGGGSYSSGGSSSSGDDGAGILVEIVLRILIELCFYHPVIGIPLLICFLLFLMYMSTTGNSLTVNSFNAAGPPPMPPSTRTRDDGVNAIKRTDPNFSTVLFTDFARLLFTRYRKAVGSEGPPVESLKPFLASPLYTKLSNGIVDNGLVNHGSSNNIKEVRDFIIGAATIESIVANHGSDQNITVRFVFNYAVELVDGTCEEPMYEEVRATFQEPREYFPKVLRRCVLSIVPNVEALSSVIWMVPAPIAVPLPPRENFNGN